MASGTIVGTIIEIEKEKQISENYKVRDFVVKEKAEQYAKEIPFQFVADKVGILDHYKVGEDVTVSYNIDVKKSKGFRFISFRAWKMEKMDGENKASAMAPNESFEKEQPSTTTDNSDDMPF